MGCGSAESFAQVGINIGNKAAQMSTKIRLHFLGPETRNEKNRHNAHKIAKTIIAVLNTPSAAFSLKKAVLKDHPKYSANISMTIHSVIAGITEPLCFAIIPPYYLL